MMLLTTLAAVLVLSDACVYRRDGEKRSWGYRDHVYGDDQFLFANQWQEGFPACDGTLGNQSPINIRSLDAITQSGYLNWNNGPIASTLSIVNNGYTFGVGGNGQLSGLTISGADFGSRTFVADAFHFHWGTALTKGSEHRLNGRASDLELHIVHYDSAYANIGAAIASGKPAVLAVTGYFVDADAVADNADFAALSNALLNGAADYPKTTNVTGFDLNAFIASAKDGGFFRYNGSLTTPTCNPIVNWIVFNSRLHISPAQARAFYDLKGEQIVVNGKTVVDSVGPNWRPVQPLGSRIVHWYPLQCQPWEYSVASKCFPYRCSSQCARQQCTSDTTCAVCKDGYRGANCEIACPDGFRGANCNVAYNYTYTVVGSVRTSAGAQLAGVTVRIASQGLQARTNAAGRYTITGVKVPASKRVVVTASNSGYAPVSVTRKFTFSLQANAHFVLAKN